MTRKPPFHDVDFDAALLTLIRSTVSDTGEEFIASLVRNLATVLGTDGAWVTEYLPEQRKLRALAFWINGDWLKGYEYGIDGTPCEPVVTQSRVVHIPDKVLDLYPRDNDLEKFSAVSYLGVPLTETNGTVMGHLSVIDSRPLPAQERTLSLMRFFAERAGAELMRLRAETGLRDREEKLRRLFESAMDAIIDLDEYGHIERVNPAAREALAAAQAPLLNDEFRKYLTSESWSRLRQLMDELKTSDGGRSSLWIPGGLQAITCAGHQFPVEATLSRYVMKQNAFYTLILRDVRERLEAERQIQSLTAEAAYLREQLDAVEGFGDIIGNSPALVRVLQDMKQVAATDATVLIEGETGTGKELIAHAIHNAGARKGKAFVKVNCAAIPASLIESEFFGHEKGAFTGATSQRDGRFALAAGGTIFLDEVGELPLDLQAKLLRVLQEGEFERVGSSHTHKVDVRVIAATNRNLKQEAANGKFREDLYYRLSVFPIHLPPLRERLDDIPLLARALVERLSTRMGRVPVDLSPDCLRRLQSYSWPGNVRELQNVIERALITAHNGRLNLDRALPDVPLARSVTPKAGVEPELNRILNVDELQRIERDNIRNALTSCDWRISGEQGAARLLGMKPSTLTSRIKALGIQRAE